MKKNPCILIPMVILLGLFVAAHADYRSRPEEYLIDSLYGLCATYRSQQAPSIASDGDNSFAVWCDWREGCDIDRTRVDVTGIILDTGGIRISIAQTVYEGWTDSIGSCPANVMRIWGTFALPV